MFLPDDRICIVVHFQSTHLKTNVDAIRELVGVLENGIWKDVHEDVPSFFPRHRNGRGLSVRGMRP